MDAREFLGLEATHNPHRWVLPIEPRVCTGHSFLFGGCGLGAAIAALEGTTGRPVVWAAAQYLSYAHPPEKMDIDVYIPVNGKHTTQARAVAHVADREILDLLDPVALLGERLARQRHGDAVTLGHDAPLSFMSSACCSSLQ